MRAELEIAYICWLKAYNCIILYSRNSLSAFLLKIIAVRNLVVHVCMELLHVCNLSRKTPTAAEKVKILVFYH